MIRNVVPIQVDAVLIMFDEVPIHTATELVSLNLSPLSISSPLTFITICSTDFNF
jgi:hypothetical protein